MGILVLYFFTYGKAYFHIHINHIRYVIIHSPVFKINFWETCEQTRCQTEFKAKGSPKDKNTSTPQNKTNPQLKFLTEYPHGEVCLSGYSELTCCCLEADLTPIPFTLQEKYYTYVLLVVRNPLPPSQEFELMSGYNL